MRRVKMRKRDSTKRCEISFPGQRITFKKRYFWCDVHFFTLAVLAHLCLNQMLEVPSVAKGREGRAPQQRKNWLFCDRGVVPTVSGSKGIHMPFHERVLYIHEMVPP
jgi:hypothetical protein